MTTSKQDLRAAWAQKMAHALEGKRVVATRYLKDEEVAALGWSESVPVIVFDDGTMLFPSMDDEGNGGGALFGQGPAPNNEELVFPVIRSYLLSAPEPRRRTSRRVSTKKWEDSREEATKRRLLKRLQRGDLVHYNCEPTLLELKEEGYIKRMAKKVVGRIPKFVVELTEKGKAA